MISGIEGVYFGFYFRMVSVMRAHLGLLAKSLTHMAQKTAAGYQK